MIKGIIEKTQNFIKSNNIYWLLGMRKFIKRDKYCETDGVTITLNSVNHNNFWSRYACPRVVQNESNLLLMDFVKKRIAVDGLNLLIQIVNIHA